MYTKQWIAEVYKDVDIVSNLLNNNCKMHMNGSFTSNMSHRYCTHKTRRKVIIDENTINECKPQIGITTLNTTRKAAPAGDAIWQPYIVSSRRIDMHDVATRILG